MSSEWARRWRALVAQPEDALRSRRVFQARSLQRSGRVTDVRPRPGELSGRVHGAQATPRLVELTMPVLDEAAWETVISAITGQVRYSARLVAELGPEGLDEELQARGVTLFPQTGEIDVTCACGDRQAWCLHALALWEAAGVQLEEDPFLLLRVRGRGRQRLLADIAAARRGGPRPRQNGIAIDQLDVTSWTRGGEALRSLLIAYGSAAAGAPALAALDDPPGWPGGVGALDLFRPMVEGAAAWARDLERGPAT